MLFNIYHTSTDLFPCCALLSTTHFVSSLQRGEISGLLCCVKLIVWADYVHKQGGKSIQNSSSWMQTYLLCTQFIRIVLKVKIFLSET